MKIGIYAGTFDPVHSGHLAFAKTALEQASLDRVILVAEKEPYRKQPHAAWDHRQAMLERATETVEKVDHDYQFAAELSRKHTMQNMLEAAHKHYGEETEVWFLAGSDLFEHMHRWEDTLAHYQYGGFMVALRDNHTKEWLEQKQTELQQHFPKLKIILVENKQPHVSSSFIRHHVAERTLENLPLPENVLAYIAKHHLYADAPASASSGDSSA